LTLHNRESYGGVLRGTTVKVIAAVLGVMLVIAASSVIVAQTPQPAPTPPPPATPPAPAPTPPASTAPRPAPPPWQPCVPNEEREVNTELRSARRPAGPVLVSATFFLPAGAVAQVVLRQTYDEGVHHYFGYIERVSD